MKVPHSLRMGHGHTQEAAQSATETKFWNVASVSEDEGEIILYGDIYSQQPKNWMTGEPEAGLYITPEGFLEDLEAVKNKSQITVRLNSCGVDLYTGIAIHNALKELSGEINVVVEGIAASAASVIMCAGDTVTVHRGSLVMIHGVTVVLWDIFNIQDIKQLIKSMDASERAVAEIYNEKTGIAVETLRSMMTKETWMTGREALNKGFANILKEEEESDIHMSADKKILYVNGISHNIEGLHNVPRNIPIQRSAKPARCPAANKRPTNKAATKTEGGKNHMTLEELRAQEPDLVSQIEQEARNAAQTQTTDAVDAERQRLADIDSIAASIPNQQLVHDAKYGDKPCTAQELCFRVMQQSAASGQQFLKNYEADGAASGVAKVGAAPNGGTPATKEEQDAADIQAVVAAYNASKGGTQK